MYLNATFEHANNGNASLLNDCALPITANQIVQSIFHVVDF